ncbi:hypothetical protein FB472_2246 [Rhodoglobus vestalii]|uniref:Signal peptidase I n=1 Tax=Rhodoglobus vestalii TaxID=193384 RepID=A0A8H2K692_9MICO|nr:Ig-like domain-containing protein [Rhodoglobus vestalii]TQO20608.1 hypothetical protein FB472_2246 [Rhodoglobus vestalii]
MKRIAALLAIVSITATVAAVGTPEFSSASFTSSTKNTVSTVSAAADWTPPVVSMIQPASPVRDTVLVTANASDSDTAIASVTLQYLPVGGSSWVTLCSATVSPYSCSWDTKLVADGSYDLRATATDAAGYSTTSATARTTVANSVLVVLTNPGEFARGSVPLTTSLYNGGTSTYTVRVQYSLAGANVWKDICTNLASPYTCSWVTTGYANDYYDLRSVAVSGSSTYVSATVADVLVDNLTPTVTMTDPGTPLSGTRTFAATATDAHSGIARVEIQYLRVGSSTYSTLCTVTALPYSCRADTTALPDGTYSFRAIADDTAGNRTTSAVISNRVLDNTVSSVSMEDPGAFITGTATLNASASSSAGVTSVRIQRAPTGTPTWADVCTDTTSPYSCVWNSATVADGLYDFQAILVDGSGKVTTSAIVTARRVDNTPLRGTDIQAANGAATVGKMEPGDKITFTYSDLVNLTSITPAWTGAALPVTIRAQDGNVVGLSNTDDTLSVERAGSTINLGTVNLKGDYVKSGKTVTFASAMTAATITVNGVQVTAVTVTFGTATGGAARTSSTLASMVWTPSAAVRDLYGNANSAAPVTETGALDREF